MAVAALIMNPFLMKERREIFVIVSSFRVGPSGGYAPDGPTSLDLQNQTGAPITETAEIGSGQRGIGQNVVKHSLATGCH